MVLAVRKQIRLNCEALILVDEDTGRCTQLSLSEKAAGVGLSTASPVYCSRTAEPDHSLPDTPLLDAAMGRRPEYSGSNWQFNIKYLPESDMMRIYWLLHVLDRFCVCDAPYHEMTMLCPEFAMPRSYLVKQGRHDLNEITT